MASSCPTCGKQVLEGAIDCPTCGAPLDVPPGDDDDHDVLVYEMVGWSPEERRQLGMLLDSEGIAHEWEGDDLLVPDSDEARVDALMDQIEFPDELEPASGEDDDEAVYGVMSDLFVVSDRLATNSTVDVDLAGEFVVAASSAGVTPAPFGIDEREWAQVQELAASITAAIESGADDEVIVRDATALRNLLRRFV